MHKDEEVKERKKRCGKKMKERVVGVEREWEMSPADNEKSYLVEK